MQCNAMQFHPLSSVLCLQSCHVLSCPAMSCHVMSCHVMSCHVVSCRVVSCRVVLRRTPNTGEGSEKRRLTRRKSVGGGRGSAQLRKETEAEVRGDAAVPAGSKKKPAAFCKNTTQLVGIIIIKQCLRTEQDTRSLCGAIFDTVIMATEHEVVKSMRAQTRLYNEGVQAAGKGHTLGPPQIWAWRGLIAGLQK